MARPFALLVVLSCLFAAPAAAQSYESPFRAGIGLDYAGLVGRDGGLVGLRLQLGLRLHEHVALYWQGQAMVGALAEPELVSVAGFAANALIVEANVGIFQVGAGPAADVMLRCDVASGQALDMSACVDGVGPGVAVRAGLRVGMFTTSADLHVSFDDGRDPMVWLMLGVGVQLGDVATEPTPPENAERRSPQRWTDAEPLDVPPSTEGRMGRALGDPSHAVEAPRAP